MKTNIFSFLFTLCILMLSKVDTFADDGAATAMNFLNYINNGEYQNASKMSSPTIQSFLTEEKINEFWSKIKSSYGEVDHFGEPIPQKSTKDQVYLIALHFKSDSLNTRVMIDSTQQISGLLFVPFAQNYAFNPPSYADTSKFTEEDVRFGLEGWTLPATLSMPRGDGKYPVVVLVHGSGPNDRDETIGGNKVFRDIAFGLASKGIAVLRYEKRTKNYGQKIMKNYKDLTIKEETIDDAIAAAEFLKTYQGIDPDRIFILGHSLGAYAMPRIARDAKGLAGVMMLGGNARKLYELIPDQYEYIFSLDGEISDIEQVELEEVKMQMNLIVNRQINDNTDRDSLLLGLPAHYWLDLLDYDPVAVASKLTLPILILQGEKDYQVSTKEFDIWKKGLSENKNVQFKLFPNLSHIMVYTEGKSKPNDYNKSGNVAIEPINEIINWIGKIPVK